MDRKTHQDKHEEVKCYYPEGLEYSIALSMELRVGCYLLLVPDLFSILWEYVLYRHIRESQCRYPRIRPVKASVLSLRWVSREYSNVLPIAHLGTSIVLCDTE